MSESQRKAENILNSTEIKTQQIKVCEMQTKEVLSEHFVTLNAYIRQEERCKVNFLSFHF